MKRLLKTASRASTLAILLATLLASGCASTPKLAWSPEIHSHPRAKQILRPGDELDISFLGASELDTVQRVRRDGYIALEILGDVQAADKSTQILREELMRLYGTQLQIKEVAIIVRSATIVFVTGAVAEPGPKESMHAVTALEAIVLAGGFDEMAAKKDRVVVLRHSNGERRGYTIDMKEVLTGRETQPFYLQPYDIVHVPRTGIDQVNQMVEQYINRMIPRIGVGISSDGTATMYF